MTKINLFSEKYQDYLCDESRLSGAADFICFPETEEELIHLIAHFYSSDIPMTFQGGRTNIVGSAIPHGGAIINFEKMNRILGMSKEEDTYYVQVQPGVRLDVLHAFLTGKCHDISHWSDQSVRIYEEFKRAPAHFWPPDPTEKSCTIGGMFCVNAGGISEFGYPGATLAYIHDVKLITGKGQSSGLGKDFLSLLSGSEGTLGAVSELSLRLVPQPRHIWGVLFLFSSPDPCLQFAKEIRMSGCAFLKALEYYDDAALSIVEGKKKNLAVLRQFPSFTSPSVYGIYLELSGENDDEIQDALFQFLDLFLALGEPEENALAASGPDDVEKFHILRHSIPEGANMLIDSARIHSSSIHKTACDIFLPSEKLDSFLSMVYSDMKKAFVKGSVWGHIGNCHLHINLFPQSGKEQLVCDELCSKWNFTVCKLGGTIACENGIGLLQKKYLQGNKDNRLKIREDLKRIFDPKKLFQPGLK